MLARLQSMALIGIEASPCEIEVDVASRGSANAAIVGLPDTAVKESFGRVAVINPVTLRLLAPPSPRPGGTGGG